MENLIDLFERINSSSLEKDVQKFLKEAIELVSSDKPISQLEKLVEEHVAESKDN
jgi:hypothetical protein